MISVSITEVLISAAVTLLSYAIVSYKWKRRHLEKLAAQLPGSPALPIFGNMLELVGSPEYVYEKLLKLSQCTSLCRIWFTHYLVVCVSGPDDIQIILNNSKTQNKTFIHKFLTTVIGNSLLTAPADIWRRHRRIISPAFSTEILKQFVPVFNKYSKVLVDKLRPHINGDQFNVLPCIRSTFLDSVCETTFGADEWTPYKMKSEYGEALDRVLEMVHMRIFKLWLYSDFIFNQLHGSEFRKVLQQLFNLPTTMIANKRKENKLMKDNPEEINGQKYRSKGFIEILLNAVESNADFTEKDVRDESVAMISAGHDTTSLTTGFCLLMLAIHQDVQEKVYQEVVEIFDNSDREVTIDDLNEMIYTEMVIKETLRLFPPATFILREVQEDIKLTSHTLPAGSNILIVSKAIHMDPKVYPNPEQFNPEHFTAEKIAKRHKYSYLPFSAGSRSCIGQLYAMMSIKIAIARLVRNYRFSTDVKMGDIKLKVDVLVRSTIGSPVKIVARKLLQNSD